MLLNEGVLVFVCADTLLFVCVMRTALRHSSSKGLCFLDGPCTSKSFQHFQFQVQA